MSEAMLEEGLGSYEPEGYDPNSWEPEFTGFAPPDDRSDHHIVMTLRADKEQPVYINEKGTVVAIVQCRLLKKDGTPGGFLKDWYANNAKSQYSSTTQLATIALAANRPLSPGMTPDDIVQHISACFQQAGEEGIRAKAETKWALSFQQVIDNRPATKADGSKLYFELDGQRAITDWAVKQAARAAQEAGLDDDAYAEAIEHARKFAHIYSDPVEGKERTVRSRVVRLTGRI